MARNALGKGLSALIREPEISPASKTRAEINSGAAEHEAIRLVDIDLIEPNPFQPRTNFDSQALDELAASIRANGVIQPLLVTAKDDRFQLVAGERRWRAAQQAELKKIPAVVRQFTPAQSLEIALVENLQREDLNPIEMAMAFERLMNEFDLTQEEVAGRTGKERVGVANALRLLKLDGTIKEMIATGVLSFGHAKALLGIEDLALRGELAKKAAAGNMTVRQIERFATKKRAGKTAGVQEELDPNVKAAIEDLQRVLGTRIHFRARTPKQPGLLTIEYYSEKQLMDLYDRLTRAELRM
jgi:ParB family transcriptional regulator, chromosome partitioning protein